MTEPYLLLIPSEDIQQKPKPKIISYYYHTCDRICLLPKRMYTPRNKWYNTKQTHIVEQVNILFSVAHG